MDSSNLPAGGRRLQPPKSQLQGPRPTPLSIHKDSQKIKKPPLPEPLHNQHQRQQPLVIYAVSPKVINVTVSDFMTTVQRLTGVSSESFSTAGDVSPAARLASVEKVMSPKERSSTCTTVVTDQRVAEEKEEMAELDRIPGILSPPTLPPVVQEMYFSPMTAAATSVDSLPFSVLHGNGRLFTSSPSGLFSNLVGSPVFSPELVGQIWNF